MVMRREASGKLNMKSARATLISNAPGQKSGQKRNGLDHAAMVEGAVYCVGQALAFQSRPCRPLSPAYLDDLCRV
jgi:hypothetical protein